MKQQSFASLAFEQKMKPTRRGLVLAEMEAVVPWSALLADTYPRYPKVGRQGQQAIQLETRLRICLMQQWHALSAPAIGGALHEILSGLALTVLVTSAKVAGINEFPHLLREVDRAVFGDKRDVNDSFKPAGCKAGVFCGVAINASRQYLLTAANKRFNHWTSSIRARAEHLFRVINASSATRRCFTGDAGQAFPLNSMTKSCLARREMMI